MTEAESLGSWEHKDRDKGKSWVVFAECGCILRFRFLLIGIGGSAGIYKPEHNDICSLGRKLAGGLKGRVGRRGFQK